MPDQDAARPLTAQQKKFAELYAAHPDGKQAAIDAGYSPKTAESQASQLLKHPKVSAYLSSLTEPERGDRIATARERQEFWTAVMRGKVQASFVTRDGIREGPPDHGSRLRAAEMLGKVQGDFRETTDDAKKSGLDALVESMAAMRARLEEGDTE